MTKKIKEKWDLSPLFKSDNDPAIEKSIKKAETETDKFVAKWSKRSDYLSQDNILKEALDEYENWIKFYGPASVALYYFELREALDQTNPNLKAGYNQTADRAERIENRMHFFTLNLAKISQATQKKMLASPKLSDYRHFLETLFAEAKHLLSENEEKIMTMKSRPSHSQWVDMTSTFLSKEAREIRVKGKKVPKTLSELSSLTCNQHKATRDQAATAFNEILAKNVDTAEAELNSILLNKKIDDELRHFDRPDQARHLNDDIETEVVDTLIDAVHKANKISHDFYKFKAKLFGVKSLDYHERNVPVGNIDQELSHKKSTDLVSRVLSNIDKEFGEIFNRFCSEGQIDVWPAKGKASGAFCAHSIMSTRTYILLNHTNRLNDALTLAHEAGHGINNELIKQKQNALNFGTPLATAEVASTFMEDFVLEEIIKTATEEERLAIMMMKLNDDISTIFRQVACYRFEQELHKDFRAKGYLSKEEIGKLFQKHMRDYMGPAVKQSAGSENWWVYWSHIRSFFYVYSYASGLLISKSLQAKIREDKNNIKLVKDFLASGLSESPKQIFTKFGIDITDKNFWQQGIKEIEEMLKVAQRLAKKLKKI